jgi:hypothetical protein
MIQDDNLYEEVGTYFEPLSSYELGADERADVFWASRGENQPIHEECFSDVRLALARAAYLAAGYDVFVVITPRRDGSAGMTGGVRLLALWCACGSGNRRDHIDGFVEFESRPYGCSGVEYRLTSDQRCGYYAARLYYPDRGCEPDRALVARGSFLERRQDKGGLR